jgi:hypothetical protein
MASTKRRSVIGSGPGSSPDWVEIRIVGAGHPAVTEPRVPHISPDFGEMWELTNSGVRVPVVPGTYDSRAVNSHISPKSGEIWGTLGSWRGYFFVP